MHKILHAKPIGILFLSAFLAFGIGQSLLGSQIPFERMTGILLVTLNSLIVITIGVLFNQTLKKHNKTISHIYLVTRILEGFLLFLMIFSFDSLAINFPKEYFYYIAMLILGVGSVPMCWLLYKDKITPSWLSIWGMVGYAVFAFGFVLELFGNPWSMYFLMIGGLWEIFFGFWLIFKKSFNHESEDHS